MYIMCIYKEIKQKYVLHSSVRQYNNTHTQAPCVFRGNFKPFSLREKCGKSIALFTSLLLPGEEE